MDMSNVKTIFNNNAQKSVKKIQDGNGNVIWRKNLFLGFDSPWCCNFSVSIANGMMSTTGNLRTTYFFAVKPNTTYRYTAKTAGDRLSIYAIKQSYDYPPSFISNNKFPYNETADNIGIIENRNSAQVYATTDYTFTTGPDDKMVYIYFSLEKRPTGVRIVEV